MCFGQNTTSMSGAPDEGDPGLEKLPSLPGSVPSTAPTVGAGPGPGPAAPGPTPLGVAGTAASLMPAVGKPGGALNKTTGAAKGAVSGAVAGAPLGPPGMAIGALLGALPSLFGKKPKVPVPAVADPSADLQRSFGGM